MNADDADEGAVQTGVRARGIPALRWLAWLGGAALALGLLLAAAAVAAM